MVSMGLMNGGLEETNFKGAAVEIVLETRWQLFGISHLPFHLQLRLDFCGKFLVHWDSLVSFVN